MTQTESIHYRRRWYYFLWSCLLVLSLGALALWLIPMPSGVGKVGIRVFLNEAPAGTVAQAWSGPAASWHREASFGSEIKPGSDGWLNFPAQAIPIARRRWSTFLHPATSDQVVLRFTTPDGTRRYAQINLNGDLNAGLLKEGRTLGYEIRVKWKAISDSADSPTGIL